MWEGWEKYSDTDDSKRYQLLVGSGVKVLLVVGLTRVGLTPFAWKVEVLSFSPGAGEYVLYEDIFPSFGDAEATAWEKAQSISATYG